MPFSDFGMHAVFGGKPRATKYKIKSPTAMYAPEIAGNVANMPEIAKLANLYSDQELSQMGDILGPDYQKNLQAGTTAAGTAISQAQQELQGQVPQDVQDAVQRSSAYQSLMGGYYGSPMSGANAARNLGLTSLDMIGRGANLLGQAGNSMQQWDAVARRNTLDPSSMFVGPQLGLQTIEEERMRNWQARQNAANIQAQPDPGLYGIYNTLDQILMAYIGAGGMGGAKGGMTGAAGNSLGGGYAATGMGGGYGAGPFTSSGTMNAGAAYGNNYAPVFNQPAAFGGSSDLYGYGGTYI